MITEVVNLINETLNSEHFQLGIQLSENDVDKVLEIDSIMFVVILVALEDRYNVEIPDEYMILKNMNTLNKIVDLLNKLLIENRL